jgi:hypothetical protein
MIGQLLMLPLRLGARGTQIVLRTAEGVAGRATMQVLQVVGAIKGDDDGGQQQAQPPAARSSSDTEAGTNGESERSATASSPRASRSATSAPARPAPPIVRAPQPEDVEAPIAPEPVHVSEEPELVREEAEPGAEDGAGASVNVLPPWEGYDRLGAREVIARLGDASSAELAAVELYERSNRSRQTVLEAVERRLKAANGRG